MAHGVDAAEISGESMAPVVAESAGLLPFPFAALLPLPPPRVPAFGSTDLYLSKFQMVTPTCVPFVEKLHCYSASGFLRSRVTRRLVYHALVGLLQDNDITVRLAPCSSLCYLCQESSFSELDLFECLPTCWTMCFKPTEGVQEFDSKVLNFISVLIEHVGDKVIPFASQLSQFFQKILHESAGESLLQIQLLAALRTFVSSLGYQSPLSYHMLIPILQSGINVDSPDALNLLEDSVLLWEVALSNAPSIVPQLLDYSLILWAS